MVTDVYQGRGSEIIKNHSKQVEKNNAKVDHDVLCLPAALCLQSICTVEIWFEESYFFNGGQLSSLMVVSENPSKGEAVNGSAR